MECVTDGHLPTRLRKFGEPGLLPQWWRLTLILAHTSEDRCLEKEKMKWTFLFRNLPLWGTQKKMKASRQQRDSTSCHIHSLPSTVLRRTRTTVRIRPNRDRVHPLSTHDPGLNPPHLLRNQVMAHRTPWSPRNPFRDRGPLKSTRLTPVHLPVRITTIIRFQKGDIDRLAISPST